MPRPIVPQIVVHPPTRDTAVVVSLGGSMDQDDSEVSRGRSMVSRMSSMVSHSQRCLICLGQAQQVSVPSGCQHRFCRACLIRWARRSNTCPVCRTPFSYVVPLSLDGIQKPEDIGQMTSDTQDEQGDGVYYVETATPPSVSLSDFMPWEHLRVPDGRDLPLGTQLDMARVRLWLLNGGESQPPVTPLSRRPRPRAATKDLMYKLGVLLFILLLVLIGALLVYFYSVTRAAAYSHSEAAMPSATTMIPLNGTDDSETSTDLRSVIS